MEVAENHDHNTPLTATTYDWSAGWSSKVATFCLLMIQLGQFSVIWLLWGKLPCLKENLREIDNKHDDLGGRWAHWQQKKCRNGYGDIERWFLQRWEYCILNINLFSSYVRYLQQLVHLCSTCFILLWWWKVDMKHINLDAMYLNQSKHGKMSFESWLPWLANKVTDNMSLVWWLLEYLFNGYIYVVTWWFQSCCTCLSWFGEGFPCDLFDYFCFSCDVGGISSNENSSTLLSW